MSIWSVATQRWSSLPSVDKIRWIVAAITFAGLLAAVFGIWMNYRQTTLLSVIRDEASTKYSGNFRSEAENLDNILAELGRVRPAGAGDKPLLDSLIIITDQFAYGSVSAYRKFFDYMNILGALASAGTKVEMYAYAENKSIEDVRAQFSESDFEKYRLQGDVDAQGSWSKIQSFFLRKDSDMRTEDMTYDRFLEELMLQEKRLLEDYMPHPNISMKRPNGNSTFPVFVWYLNLGDSDERAFFSFVDATDESNEFTFFTREPNLLNYLRGVIMGVRKSSGAQSESMEITAEK